MLGSARDEVAPVLGRAQEQSLLTSILDGVEDHGQALVLRGEPGIGKSRLLSVAAQRARDRGMTVLTATGVQSEANLPFAGLHQLFRPVRERAAGLPPVQRDALDAAFRLTRDVAPERYRIAMASLDLVSDVAGDAPLARRTSRCQRASGVMRSRGCWPPSHRSTPAGSPRQP